MYEEVKSKWTLISAKETSQLLGISIASVYTLLKNDANFPAIRIGSRWIIFKEKIPEWYDEQYNMKKNDEML